MDNLIFRCSGHYFGYIEAGCFYQGSGRYVGWLENNLIFDTRGALVGELYKDRYIVRTGGLAQNRTPKVPGISMNQPLNPGMSLPLQLPAGWEDALEHMGLMPVASQLFGCWANSNGKLEFADDGSYRHSTIDGTAEPLEGTWELKGNRLSINIPSIDEPPRQFTLLEYTGNSITLRILSDSERSIPFTLHRSD